MRPMYRGCVFAVTVQGPCQTGTCKAQVVVEPLPYLSRIKCALFVCVLMNTQIPVVHRDVKKTVV